MNHKVEQQKDLTQILDDFQRMQQDFDKFQKVSGMHEKDAYDYAQDFLGAYADAIELANRSEFGPLWHGPFDPKMTSLGDQLYKETGKRLCEYITFSWDGNTLVPSYDRNDERKLWVTFHNAWYHAEKSPDDDSKQTEVNGDNGAAVKSWQDTFNGMDSVVTGEQGTVQAALKYLEQVYSSVESVMKNIGQGLNSLMKNANDGEKAN